MSWIKDLLYGTMKCQSGDASGERYKGACELGDAGVKAELAAICPEVLTDPDVKILYKPGVTEIAAEEYRGNTDYDVAYFPDVVTVLGHAFEKSSVRYAIFPKATMVQAGAFIYCENLRYAYFPSLVEARRNAFGSTGIIHADFPALETVGEQYTGKVFAYCESLVSINMPKLKGAYVDGGTHFKGDQKLTDVNLPELECVEGEMFNDCSALTKIDLPKATKVGRRAFEKSGIETLILRSETVATLVHTNAFNSTLIASGTGYIYVPSALIEDYKVATNWSTYAAQFRAIEDWPEICSTDLDEPITKKEVYGIVNEKMASADGTIPKIESLDTENLVVLRDLESGTYVLYGRFVPFTGSDSTISFSSSLLVNVLKRTDATHVQVFYPYNNCVQHLAITDTEYTRTDVYLNDLAAAAAT